MNVMSNGCIRRVSLHMYVYLRKEEAMLWHTQSQHTVPKMYVHIDILEDSMDNSKWCLM